MNAAAVYLQDVRVQFEKIETMVESALTQAREEDLTVSLDPESNSLAVIVKHMAGNLRSRFTEFLTTDGEKPDRDRDSEFEAGDLSRAALMDRWEEGWRCLFAALGALTPDDLLREVTIRNERMPVIQALNRALSHQAQHAGQVVFLVKHLRSAEWRTLSIPKRRA
jgi:uncharacterized protein DUF1572